MGQSNDGDKIKEDKVMILGEQLGKVESEKLQYIEINLIKPNTNQPRKVFNEGELKELANSIRQYGVLQPIILQPEKDFFTIVAGERRWRACKIAEIKEIPSIIKLPSEKKDCSAISLIENLHRKDLKVTEEAAYYEFFLEETKCTQEELAKKIGKSRSYVANLVRINNLSTEIKDKIDIGELSLGHAKVIAGQKNPEQLTKIITEKKLNVRETENLVKNYNIEKSSLKKITINQAKQQKEESIPDDISSDLGDIEKFLQETLETKVKMNVQNNNQGKIIIKFSSLEDLDNILSKIHAINKNN